MNLAIDKKHQTVISASFLKSEINDILVKRVIEASKIETIDVNSLNVEIVVRDDLEGKTIFIIRKDD